MSDSANGARGNTIAALPPSEGPRNPVLRVLKALLPAPVRAWLWRVAGVAKRWRHRGVRRARKALGLRTGPRPDKRRGGVPVKVGRHLHPEQQGRVPVVMIVTLGLDDDELAGIVEAVAWQQTFQQSFAPLFVTDRLDPRPFREHDYLYEYVMPFEDWSRFSDPELWPDFVTERLTELASVYRPQSVTSVGLDRPLGGIALGVSTYAAPVLED